MALYENLTATSTPEEIAAAYQEFTGMVGGDTQDAQTRAVDYLTGLGVAAPTITQAYDQYLSPVAAPLSGGALSSDVSTKSPLSDAATSTVPQGLTSEVDPYVYAYEYGVANKDFSGLRSLLDKTPDSTALISKYSLNPTQINQIEFGTGFDLDQSGGYGAGRKGNEWDYGKYVDKLKAGDAESLSGAFDALATQDPLMANRARNLYEELLAQQKFTGNQWATGNLGSKDAAAMDFALRLAENNVNSVYDLGQRTFDTVSDWQGTPIVTQNVEYYNKKTGEALPDWGRVAQGTQSGTKLDYQLNFADDGTPIPYTTNAQSDWMGFREGFLKPAISIVAMANPALMPYVAAGNALNAASKGDWGSAIVSGLTAAAGFGGDLGFTKETMAMLNQAKTGAQVLNALDKSNPLAIANALMQTDTGKDLISMDMGGGVTLGDVLNTARVAAAVNEGDFASAASYAGSLLNNPDLKVAGSSLALMDAIKTGDPFKVTAAVANLDRAVKTVTKDSGGGITNRITDDMTEAGAAAFADARRAGASDEDAMAAANALTTIADANETFDGSGFDTQNAAMNAAIADGKDKFTFGGKTFAIDNSAAMIADFEKSVAAEEKAASDLRAKSDPEYGDLTGAQAAATARNTVAIGNAEADNPDEAAYLAKLRDPTATQFSYGGKTYTMGVSSSVMDKAIAESKAAELRDNIANAPTRAEAFKIAREGKLGANDVFTWQGKSYSAGTAEERPDLVPKTTEPTVAAATDQSAAETNRLLGQNASLVTGNAPNQSAAETARLNNLNAGLSASATKTQTDAAKAAINSVFGNGFASDLVTQGLSNIHQATGQTLAFLGGTASALGLTGPNNTLTQAGNAQTKAGEGIQLEAINAANSNVIGAVQKAEGFIPKVVAGAKAIIENPLSANMAAIELLQEALPIGVAAKVYGLAGKYAAIGVDVALNAIESGGAAYNERYDADIKAGKSPEKADSDATKSFWVASAVTAVTGGITDMALVNKITKTLDDAAAKAVTKPVSTGAVSGAKEAGSEGAEVFATGVLTALALGEKPDINKILTQTIVEGYVGGKTSGSLDATNTAIDTASGAGKVGATAVDLGDVGAARPGAEVTTGTDLGSIGKVTPGADTAVVNQGTISVADAQATMSDLGLTVSDDSAVSLATKIQEAANSGNDVSFSSDANIVTINDATANTKTTVDANTGTTTVVDANTNTTTQTKVDANTQTTVTTNANTNTNTQTTVDTNTNVTTNTNVNTNTNVATQTTTNPNTNITTNTTVNPNTNITTQTTTNANTNIETTVVTDTNTNIQTTVTVNTNTGEIITKKETVIPDDWTPPEIDVPVVPTLVTPPTVSPPKAPAPAAPKLPAGSRTGAGGVLGLPSEINVDPASLRSKVTEGAIDPLARVKQAQAELERDVMMSQMDPRFLNVIQQRSDPQQQSKQFDSDIGALAKMLSGETDAPANQSKYYSYGSEDSIDDILGGKAANYKEGGFVEPLKASGGMVLPLLAKSGGALGHYKGREDFKHGKHVAGDGDGQSDDIPAWLADGEFVFPADVVSALGNGSTKAGTDKLYEMMHGIRDRARSKGPKDLPPPALKSPLNYLKSSKRSTS
jgi:hypothetical protein